MSISNDAYVHWEHFVKWTNLFEIKQVYTQDDFYVFEDIDGNFFHANIAEFGEKWIMSGSLTDWTPPLDTDSNLVRWFVINNTSTSIQLLKDSKIVSTLVGDLIVVVDKTQWDIIVVNENLLEYINLDDKGTQTPLGHPIAHPYGTIEKIWIDKNSNFLLIVSRHDSWFSVDKEAGLVPTVSSHKLHIVNRKTLEEVQSFNDIADIIQVDNKNDLTCLGTDGKLASIDTNFDQFPVRFVDTGTIGKKQVVEVTNMAHSQLDAVLSNGWLQIDLGSISNGKAKNGNGNHKQTEFISKLWETKVGEKTLKELFDEADDEEKMDLIYGVLLQIKSNPTVSAVGWITDSIESAIHEKRFAIRLQDVKNDLENIEDIFEQTKENSETEEYKYFPTLVSLQSQLQELKKLRSQIPLLDEALDRGISEISSLLDAEIVSFKIQNSPEIVATIEDNLSKIETFLASISFLAQITQVYNTELYKQTESLVGYLEDSEKNSHKETLGNLISKRISEIGAQEKIIHDKEVEKLKKQIMEMEAKITETGRIIDSVEDEWNLEIMRKSDSLILRLRHDLELLPKSEAEKLSLSLENLFTERKQKIRLKKLDVKWIIHSLDEYGIDTSLYYANKGKKQVSFKIIWNKTANGMIRLELHYDDGTTFDLDKYLQDPTIYAHAIAFDSIKAEMDQSDFIKLQKNIASWEKSGKTKLGALQKKFRESLDDSEKKDILKQIADLKQSYLSARSIRLFANTLANKLNLNPRSRLELPNPKFIILDEEKELLSKMSAGFDIQKLEQKWIDILEGPPGLGKTEICRFFAAVTNREIVRVQCSKMDPSDLFFSPQLKAGETTRQPAEWIRLMQKPGTIILFDEIDKLNPQSFERLHSLFDNARAIYDPQIGSVKAHNDCLFVGTRNSYEKMSNPIVSRSVIIQVEVPSELNEAFKVAKYTNLEFFEKLNFEDFKKLWELWEASKGANQWKMDVAAKKIHETLSFILSLIWIFSELRQKQTSDSFDEKFEYEMSYRDAEQIFLRFNRSPKASFKEKVLEVLVPKARAVVYENDDKNIQEKIVREIVSRYLK